MDNGRTVLAMAVLAGVILAATGCSIFEEDRGPQLATDQSPALAEGQLDALRLTEVRELFPQPKRITVERLDLPDVPNESLLGGQYVLGPDASIAVRLYGEERDVLTALNARLRGPLAAYQLGDVTPVFPFTWWCQEGPPATIVYTYGKALVVIRMSTLAPREIPTKGLAAAREVALRILRVSQGKPAMVEE